MTDTEIHLMELKLVAGEANAYKADLRSVWAEPIQAVHAESCFQLLHNADTSGGRPGTGRINQTFSKHCFMSFGFESRALFWNLMLVSRLGPNLDKLNVV